MMTTLLRISSVLVYNEFLQGIELHVHVGAVQTKSRHSEIKAHELALHWGIGIETAERTLKATTQLGVQSAIHPLHCRYRTKQLQYRYNQLNTKLYADVFLLSVPLLSGNTCGVILVNNLGFLHIALMKSKSEAGNTLTEIFEDKGVPTVMHTDGAKEFTQGRWKEILSQHGGIKQTFAEPYIPWQNQAEAGIREYKKQVLRVLRWTRASKHLWDYAAIYVSEVRSRTAYQLYELHGRTPYEIVAGDTPSGYHGMA